MGGDVKFCLFGCGGMWMGRGMRAGIKVRKQNEREIK